MPTRKRVRESQAGTQVSNVQAFSVREFFAQFDSDDACLTRIIKVRYDLRHVCGKCGKDATFHKLAERRPMPALSAGITFTPALAPSFRTAAPRFRFGSTPSICSSRPGMACPARSCSARSA